MIWDMIWYVMIWYDMIWWDTWSNIANMKYDMIYIYNYDILCSFALDYTILCYIVLHCVMLLGTCHGHELFIMGHKLPIMGLYLSTC